MNNNSSFEPFQKIEHDSKKIWIHTNDNDRFSDILINKKKYNIKRLYSYRIFDNKTRFNQENRLYFISNILDFSKDKLMDDYNLIINDIHIINKASSLLLNVLCKIKNMEIIEEKVGTIAKIFDIRFEDLDTKDAPNKKVLLDEKTYCKYLSTFARSENRFKYITGLYHECISMRLGQKNSIAKNDVFKHLRRC